MSTSRRYCFTCFETDTLLDLDDVQYLKYGIYQLELSPTTGAPHFQGYLHFSRPVRMAHCKNIPGLEKAHFESAKGSPQSNISYCSKLDSRLDGPWTYGETEPGPQGRRTDIESLKGAIMQGLSDIQIFEGFPQLYLRFEKAIRSVRMLYAPPRRDQTPVYLVLGPTGFGKTTYVMDQEADAYYKNRSKWWDNFNGSSPVVLDDYYGWLPYDELLRLCNPSPYQVETKGSMVNFNPKCIWITSNKLPTSWYQPKYDPKPILRRITRIHYFTGLRELSIFEARDDDNAWTRFQKSEIYENVISETENQINPIDEFGSEPINY